MANEDPRLLEWQTTRELLFRLDRLVHDIRRYGFSFVAALLTAQAILVPSSELTSWGKTAVLIITLILILAIAFFEKYYHLLQEAAAQRALILELELNLGLTGTIQDQFNTEKIRKYEIFIYLSLIAGTIILGWTVLDLLTAGILSCVALVIGYLIARLKPIKNQEWKGLDWCISPLECEKGDLIEINVINLEKTRVYFSDQNPIAWIITDQNYNHIHKEVGPPIELKQYHTYKWFWDTKNIDPGVYRVFPYGMDYDLRKTIKITE